MADILSVKHYKAVWAEIQGRFFSIQESQELIEAIQDRTITDPHLRAAAAKCWDDVTLKGKE